MPWILHEIKSYQTDVTWIAPKDSRDHRTRILDGIHNATFSGDPSVFPLVFTQHSNHSELPAFMHGGSLGEILISKEFRDLIEEWDPNQSNYFPVELHCASGDILKDNYFLFKFKSFVDGGIIAEKSDVQPVKDLQGEVDHYGSTALPKLVWNKDKISGRHVFADKFLGGRFSVSDELMDAIEAMGFGDFRKVQSFEE